MKNKIATPLGSKFIFRNKEIMSQCNSQSAESVIVDILIIHFDQEKFEELLSGVVQCTTPESIGESPLP